VNPDKLRLISCSDGECFHSDGISYPEQLLLLVHLHHQAVVQLYLDSVHLHHHISVLSLQSIVASSVDPTIAAILWQSRMLNYMREECPLGTSEETPLSIYGSISTLKTKYDCDDLIRVGAVAAYTRTNRIMFTLLWSCLACLLFLAL
jgi:hypothetical protein